MSARLVAFAVAGVLLSGCDTRQRYELSPITGLATVDVSNPRDVRRRIVDKRQVAAIVAFVNARRDQWYDPKGEMFATTGQLDLLDVRGKEIASIAFGPGGMFQSRPTMTYRDSVALRQLILIRAGPPAETEKDFAALCDLLGPKLFHFACAFQ